MRILLSEPELYPGIHLIDAEAAVIIARPSRVLVPYDTRNNEQRRLTLRKLVIDLLEADQDAINRDAEKASWLRKP